MARVLGMRGVRLVITLLVVSMATALMLSLLPGDPALQVIGADHLTSVDQLEQVREELGLNDPIHIRYWNWLSAATQGDLGWSYARRQPVGEAIADRLPVTVNLLVYAQVMALLIALAIAPIAALRRNSLFDQLTSTISFAALSIPSFILGLVLIYFFAVTLGWFQVVGYTPISDGLWANFRSLFLPALTLAASEAAVYTRLLRSEIVNTLQEDYISLARAKGLPQWRIILRHALRPSSFALVTVVGLSVGHLVGGALIVETLFALPGMGRLVVDSIIGGDFVMVQGVVSLVTIGYVVVNFLVDMLYLGLDPRIRRVAV